MRMLAHVRAVLAASAAALAACDVTAPWSSAPGDPISRDVTVSPGVVTFSGQVGFEAPVWPQFVAIEGVGSGVWVYADGSDPFISADAGPTSVRVTVPPPGTLGPGVFEGVIRLRACPFGRPTSCADLGDDAAITVRYVIAPAPLSVSPSALQFEQLVGGPAAPTQTLAVSGPPGDGPWTASVEPGSGGWLVVWPGDGTATPASVSAGISAGWTALAPGASTASLRFTRAGYDLRVPASLTARAPAVDVGADPLSFAVREREAFVAEPPRVTIATEQDAAVEYTTQVTYAEAGVPAWLSVPARGTTPAVFPVSLATTDLPAGAYHATLRVRDRWGMADASFPVALEVSPALLSFSPSALSWTVTATTTPAETTATVALSTDGSPVSWTATTDVPWLQVAPSAGTTASGAPSDLTVALVPAALPPLARGVHSGRVEIVSAGERPAVVRIPVSLDLQLPRIDGIGPGLDVAGATHEVIVAGEGLDGAPGVLLGDRAATITAKGNVAIFATAPALAPGSYRVTVPTAMGVSLGGATYRVAAPVDLAAAAFDAPGAKERIWFDDERRELWAANTATGALERFRAADGWVREALALPGLRDATPTLDGARVLTWSDAGFRFVDAATLALSAEQPADVTSPSWAGYRGRVELLVDGWAVFLGTVPADRPDASAPYFVLDPGTNAVRDGMWGSTRGTHTTATLRDRSGFEAGRGVVSVSHPGALETWERSAMVTGEPYTLVGAYLPFPPDGVADDRSGRRSLAVRDGSGSPGASFVFDRRVGPVTGSLPASVATALLTQDGLRAVAFDGVARTVRSFDLSVPPDPGTGLFVEIGTPGGVAPAADPGGDVVLALSADDRILFVSGDARAAVVPLP